MLLVQCRHSALIPCQGGGAGALLKPKSPASATGTSEDSSPGLWVNFFLLTHYPPLSSFAHCFIHCRCSSVGALLHSSPCVTVALRINASVLSPLGPA